LNTCTAWILIFFPCSPQTVLGLSKGPQSPKIPWRGRKPRSPRSSDDSCIVLSDDDEIEEEDTDDVPHNRGFHVNETYNIPDGYMSNLENDYLCISAFHSCNKIGIKHIEFIRKIY
jgi:hypothetical protein